jgi:hypothetical protein
MVNLRLIIEGRGGIGREVGKERGMEGKGEREREREGGRDREMGRYGRRVIGGYVGQCAIDAKLVSENSRNVRKKN